MKTQRRTRIAPAQRAILARLPIARNSIAAAASRAQLRARIIQQFSKDNTIIARLGREQAAECLFHTVARRGVRCRREGVGREELVRRLAAGGEGCRARGGGGGRFDEGDVGVFRCEAPEVVPCCYGLGVGGDVHHPEAAEGGEVRDCKDGELENWYRQKSW